MRANVGASLVLGALTIARGAPAEELSLDVHGFVAAQAAIDSNDAGQQTQISYVPGSGSSVRTSFAFDASRVAVHARSWSDDREHPDADAAFEFDLQNAMHFRPRQVFVRAALPFGHALVGLSDTLVGNRVGPHLFNNQWLWGQGNAYDRVPQLRVEVEASWFYGAVAAVPSAVVEEYTSVPHVQARLGIRRGAVSLGLSGHGGVTSASALRRASSANGPLPAQALVSVLGSLDLQIDLAAVVFTAQAWWSRAGGSGTGAQAIGGAQYLVGADGSVCAPDSFGGFVDVMYRRGRLAAGVTLGTNTVPDSSRCGADATSLAANETIDSYLYWHFTERLVGVVEFQESITRYRAAGSGTRAYECSICADARYLTGAKFDF